MRQSARTTFEAGRYGRSAPLGCQNVTDPPPGFPNIEADPLRASLISKGFELMAEGNLKATDVLRILNAEGLRTKKGKDVPIQSFGELLKNSIYIGVQRSKAFGEEKAGLWQPIVDERTFKNVQLVLSGKKPARAPYCRNNPAFPSRGTLLCNGCGRALTAGRSTGRGEKRYDYYWCKTSGCRAVKSTPSTKIEAEFVELLQSLRSSPEFEERVMPEIERAWAAQGLERSALIEQIRSEKAQQQQLLEKLVDMRVRGDIDRDVFESTQQRYQEALYGSNQWLTEVEMRQVQTVFSRIFSRNVVLDVSTAWLQASLDRRQMVQKILLPMGIRYSQEEGFLNPDKASLFSQLHHLIAEPDILASPTGFEPVLPP